MTTARFRATVATTAVLAVVAFVVSGCGPQQHVVEGSEVTVVTDQPFTSANAATSYGNTASNRTIAYATNARFNSYTPDARLERDTSFGSYERLSSDPLTVRYTIAGGVTWSDGVKVDAADLLLAWAANSGHFSTPEFSPNSFVDPATGRFSTEYPTDVVYFDGAPSVGLEHVTEVPETSDDGRSITLVYDEFVVDWELAFQVGVPAHVVAQQGLGTTEATAGKEAVLRAIRESDEGDLADLSRAWNDDFNFDEMPSDESLLVGSGPYTVTAIEPGESVTLTANPLYRGRNQPSIETVRVLTLADPLAAANALADGEADVATPTASPDVLAALDGVDGVTVETTAGGTWEHVDLQFANGRHESFEDPLVREAFLAIIPRQRVLDELVVPLQDDAEVLESLVFLAGQPGYDESVAENGSRNQPDADLAAARALLAKAGNPRPRVCILFDPTNPRRIAEYGLIRESAIQAGFVVSNCSKPKWADFLGVPGAYDAALFGWNTTNLAVTAAQARLGSGSDVSNFSHYTNDDVDGLLEELSTTEDAAAQRSLLAEVDAALWRDSYGLPLYQFPVVTAHSSRVTGVENSAFEPGVVWNIWNWKPTADSESSGSSR